MKNRRENAIQAAIQGALQVYCRSRSLQLFPPYANQQGDAMRQYCADLVGILEDGDLILLEIKQLDCVSGDLIAFDSAQHSELVQMEQLGVPVAYAYNSVSELPYHAFPQPNGWETDTLSCVNRAVPSELPSRHPDAHLHETLLDWLLRSRSSGAVELFGKLHGAIRSARELRNGVLVLLYSKASRKLASLSPEEVKSVVRVLESSPHLSMKKQAALSALLAESADVFQRFSSPPSPSAAPSPRPRP